MAISDEVRREGLASIAVAAAMLVEDAHEALTTASATDDKGDALPTLLGSLSADLTALAGAASVFARGR